MISPVTRRAPSSSHAIASATSSGSAAALRGATAAKRLSACARYDLQLLDDTVSFARLRLGRDEAGQLKIARTYTFEFSDTGNNRRHGAIVMLGAELQDMQLEPYALQ